MSLVRNSSGLPLLPSLFVTASRWRYHLFEVKEEEDRSSKEHAVSMHTLDTVTLRYSAAHSRARPGGWVPSAFPSIDLPPYRTVIEAFLVLVTAGCQSFGGFPPSRNTRTEDFSTWR